MSHFGNPFDVPAECLPGAPYLELGEDLETTVDRAGSRRLVEPQWLNASTVPVALATTRSPSP